MHETGSVLDYGLGTPQPLKRFQWMSEAGQLNVFAPNIK
jgi:hypothetical protein